MRNSVRSSTTLLHGGEMLRHPHPGLYSEVDLLVVSERSGRSPMHDLSWWAWCAIVSSALPHPDLCP
ncbi:unnamed protein product [Pylaiella littoralis]